MDCRTTRLLFSEAQHGRLSPDDLQQRQLHLRSCEACSQAERSDSALTLILHGRLPRHPASDALRARLETQWPGNSSGATLSGLRCLLVPIAAAATLALALALGFSMGRRQGNAIAALGVEAVNDHLRMLEGETPLQVLTSDLHQVKPWFAGKLDFAPPIAFRGDEDYPLLGGQVARFLERRVACFVFARRLHKISLFVLPKRSLTDTGEVTARFSTTPEPSTSSRGFSVVSWESGEFDYLLVSDLNAAELRELGHRIQAAR
jgi:anti-sigma factor RsiW